MPIQRTPTKEVERDVPAYVHVDGEADGRIAGPTNDAGGPAHRPKAGCGKRVASSPVEDTRSKDMRISQAVAHSATVGVTSEPTEDGGDGEDVPDESEFITVTRSRRARAPKVVVEKKGGVIFSTDDNSLELHFNDVCDFIAKHVKGKMEEPRFTRSRELLIVVEAEEDRATLLSLQELANVKVSARISGGRSTVKGKISGVHPSISEATILAALQPCGVSEAIRVKTKDPKTNIVSTSEQVILTFAGGNFPAEVRLGLKRHGVVLYREPMQCFKCYSMDHFAANCKLLNPRCRKCGSTEHLRKDCKAQARCSLCFGEHEATWGSCPHRLKRMELLQKSSQNSIGKRLDAPLVPLCTPVGHIQASDNFSRRTWSSVVKNGIKVNEATSKPQRPEPPKDPALTSAPPATVENNLSEQHVPLLKVEDIVQQVISKIMPMLKDIIAQTVARTIQEVIPSILGGLMGAPSAASPLLQPTTNDADSARPTRQDRSADRATTSSSCFKST